MKGKLVHEIETQGNLRALIYQFGENQFGFTYTGDLSGHGMYGKGEREFFPTIEAAVATAVDFHSDCAELDLDLWD